MRVRSSRYGRPINPLATLVLPIPALVELLVKAASEVRSNWSAAGAPFVLGVLATASAALAYLTALSGDDLGGFFSAAAQVLIGVLIALAVEVRTDRPREALEAALQFMGLLTVLLGVVFALTGMLISKQAEVVMAVAFSLTWGGLVAGFASMILAIDAGRQTGSASGR